MRSYRIYKPAIYTATTPVPLVLNLHGYTSNAVQQEFYGDFRKIADTANFLVVMPNGTLDGQNNGFWNTFNGPSPVDDVAFISNLIDSLTLLYNIDVNRIYSTGMSNGGFMSYLLACELSDRITAIASVTGSMTNSNLAACNPGRPVPAMEIHGTNDPTVAYNGSVPLDFASIPNVVAKWLDLNNCNTTAQVTNLPNINTTDGCTAERYLYTGGDKGSTVEHYKVINGAHTWPGAFFNIGVTNQDFNASQEIWRFFRQYRLDQLSNTGTPVEAADICTISPNPASAVAVLSTQSDKGFGKIALFDLTGRLVLEQNTNGQQQVSLPLAQLGVGLYVVRAELMDGGVFVGKVLVGR